MTMEEGGTSGLACHEEELERGPDNEDPSKVIDALFPELEDRRAKIGCTCSTTPTPENWPLSFFLMFHEPIRVALQEMEMVLDGMDPAKDLYKAQRLYLWYKAFFEPFTQQYFLNLEKVLLPELQNPTSLEKEKGHKEKLVLCCPQNHKMPLMPTDHDLFCNVCGEGFPSGTPVFECRECDYDVCGPCGGAMDPGGTAAAALFCSQNHRMAFGPKDYKLFCNVCEVVLPPGTAVFECRQCDHDVCGPCSRAMRHRASPAGSVAGVSALQAPPLSGGGGGGGGGDRSRAGTSEDLDTSGKGAAAAADLRLAAALLGRARHDALALELLQAWGTAGRHRFAPAAAAEDDARAQRKNAAALGHARRAFADLGAALRAYLAELEAALAPVLRRRLAGGAARADAIFRRMLAGSPPAFVDLALPWAVDAGRAWLPPRRRWALLAGATRALPRDYLDFMAANSCEPYLDINRALMNSLFEDTTFKSLTEQEILMTLRNGAEQPSGFEEDVSTRSRTSMVDSGTSDTNSVTIEVFTERGKREIIDVLLGKVEDFDRSSYAASPVMYEKVEDGFRVLPGFPSDVATINTSEPTDKSLKGSSAVTSLEDLKDGSSAAPSLNEGDGDTAAGGEGAAAAAKAAAAAAGAGAEGSAGGGGGDRSFTVHSEAATRAAASLDEGKEDPDGSPRAVNAAAAAVAPLPGASVATVDPSLIAALWAQHKAELERRLSEASSSGGGGRGGGHSNSAPGPGRKESEDSIDSAEASFTVHSVAQSCAVSRLPSRSHSYAASRLPSRSPYVSQLLPDSDEVEEGPPTPLQYDVASLPGAPQMAAAAAAATPETSEGAALTPWAKQLFGAAQRKGEESKEGGAAAAGETDEGGAGEGGEEKRGPGSAQGLSVKVEAQHPKEEKESPKKSPIDWGTPRRQVARGASSSSLTGGRRKASPGLYHRYFARSASGRDLPREGRSRSSSAAAAAAAADAEEADAAAAGGAPVVVRVEGPAPQAQAAAAAAPGEERGSEELKKMQSPPVNVAALVQGATLGGTRQPPSPAPVDPAEAIPWARFDVALEMQEPWAMMLLRGEKTVEVRRYPLPRALAGRKLHILQSPSAGSPISLVPDQVDAGAPDLAFVGTVVFKDSFEYASAAAFAAEEPLHRVGPGSAWAAAGAGGPGGGGGGRGGGAPGLHGWRVARARPYLDPRPTPHLQRKHRSLFEIVEKEEAEDVLLPRNQKQKQVQKKVSFSEEEASGKDGPDPTEDDLNRERVLAEGEVMWEAYTRARRPFARAALALLLLGLAYVRLWQFAVRRAEVAAPPHTEGRLPARTEEGRRFEDHLEEEHYGVLDEVESQALPGLSNLHISHDEHLASEIHKETLHAVHLEEHRHGHHEHQDGEDEDQLHVEHFVHEHLHSEHHLEEHRHAHHEHQDGEDEDQLHVEQFDHEHRQHLEHFVHYEHLHTEHQDGEDEDQLHGDHLVQEHGHLQSGHEHDEDGNDEDQLHTEHFVHKHGHLQSGHKRDEDGDDLDGKHGDLHHDEHHVGEDEVHQAKELLIDEKFDNVHQLHRDDGDENKEYSSEYSSKQPAAPELAHQLDAGHLSFEHAEDGQQLEIVAANEDFDDEQQTGGAAGALNTTTVPEIYKTLHTNTTRNMQENTTAPSSPIVASGGEGVHPKRFSNELRSTLLSQEANVSARLVHPTTDKIVLVTEEATPVQTAVLGEEEASNTEDQSRDNGLADEGSLGSNSFEGDSHMKPTKDAPVSFSFSVSHEEQGDDETGWGTTSYSGKDSQTKATGDAGATATPILTSPSAVEEDGLPQTSSGGGVFGKKTQTSRHGPSLSTDSILGAKRPSFTSMDDVHDINDVAGELKEDPDLQEDLCPYTVYLEELTVGDVFGQQHVLRGQNSIAYLDPTGSLVLQSGSTPNMCSQSLQALEQVLWESSLKGQPWHRKLHAKMNPRRYGLHTSTDACLDSSNDESCFNHQMVLSPKGRLQIQRVDSDFIIWESKKPKRKDLVAALETTGNDVASAQQYSVRITDGNGIAIFVGKTTLLLDIHHHHGRIDDDAEAAKEEL